MKPNHQYTAQALARAAAKGFGAAFSLVVVTLAVVSLPEWPRWAQVVGVTLMIGSVLTMMAIEPRSYSRK